MSVAKSFVFETDVPEYQRAAVEWLKGYKGTRPLQDILQRCRFSPQEVEAFRRIWPMWLEPKAKMEEKIHRGIH